MNNVKYQYEDQLNLVHIYNYGNNCFKLIYMDIKLNIWIEKIIKKLILFKKPIVKMECRW